MELLVLAIFSICALHFLAKKINGTTEITKITGVLIRKSHLKGQGPDALFVKLIPKILREDSLLCKAALVDSWEYELQQADGKVIKFKEHQDMGTEGSEITVYEQKHSYFNKVELNYFTHNPQG